MDQARAADRVPRLRLEVVGLSLSALWGLVLTAMVVRGDGASAFPMGVILLSQAAIPVIGRASPGALLAAAIVGWPLGLVSFAGVGLPYLIPSIIFIVALSRRPSPCGRQIMVAFGVVAILVTAFMLMATSTEMRCHPIPNGTSCGEETTQAGATLSSAIAVVAVVGGGLLLRPRPDR